MPLKETAKSNAHEIFVEVETAKINSHEIRDKAQIKNIDPVKCLQLHIHTI